jgi:arginine Nomega-methyltransferase
MPLPDSDTPTRRQPLLTLVDSGRDQLRRDLPLARDEDDISASQEGRMSLAALQTTAGELHRLGAVTQDAVSALLAGKPSSRQSAVQSALRTIPRWHFAMLNDRARNDLFALALQRRVQPGSHVLDIGSGTGLLAMLAVRAGAAHVTTCEVNPLLAEVSRQVIEAHGMADSITVVGKHSTDLVIGEDMPAPADLVISEIVDCGLIGEGLLQTIRHAREHLLAPGGEMLPTSGRIIGCLIESSQIANLNRVTTAAGYDVRLLNRFATPGHFPVRLTTWPHRLLTEPVQLAEFDLQRSPLDDGSNRVCVTAQHDGTAHGVVAWFDLDLGADVLLHNAPTVAQSHWMQAFLPWTDPIDVTAGEQIAVDLAWSEARLTAHPVATTRLERRLT